MNIFRLVKTFLRIRRKVFREREVYVTIARQGTPETPEAGRHAPPSRAEGAGPGAALAIIACAVAAPVLVIVVIVAIAASLTGGGPAPQAATAGNAGVAASGNAAASASDCDQAVLVGNAALPVSAASVADSLHQVIATCLGHQVPVTCSPYTPADGNPPGEESYACTIPVQDVPVVELFGDNRININPSTGAWSWDSQA